jgi:sugar O-acyltransferase (sialic acid O-acetyltransferase NeuD family)
MKLAIFGYGGHAREVAAQIGKPVTFYVDNQYVNDVAQPISNFNPEEESIMIAVANSKDREEIVNQLPSNTKYFSFIHPTAQVIGDDITIGVGSFIGMNTILTTNIKLGEHTLLNRGNQIGHDTIIGNYFSAMPGAIVSGNVTIEDCVYMGTNSSIKEKMIVCSRVIIGSNAAVVKHITKSGTYVGVPTKKIN